MACGQTPADACSAAKSQFLMQMPADLNFITFHPTIISRPLYTRTSTVGYICEHFVIHKEATVEQFALRGRSRVGFNSYIATDL